MPLVLAVLGALLVGIGSAAAECTDCDGDGFAWPLDCNDVDSTIHPGAAEVCDGHDNDCDGLVDNQPGCHTICEGPQNIGPEIIFATPSITNIAPKSVWSGAEYGIVWVATLGSNIRTLFFARVSQSGSPIGAAFRLSDGSATSTAPAMVWGPGEFGIAWADNRDGNFEIYFTRVSANGAKLGSDLRITNAASDSFHPAIAWTGSEYAIVWEDYRTNSLGDIYFVRLDSSGARLSVDIPIVHNPFGSTAPSVAWTGFDYGVAWRDFRDTTNLIPNSEIYFARVDPLGNKVTIDRRLTHANFESYQPSLAWDGSGFGVAWTDNRDGESMDYPEGQPLDVFLDRLDLSGNLIGGEFSVDNDPARSMQPSLVWIGSEYAIAWRDGRDEPLPGYSEIYFAGFDAQGLQIGSALRVTNDPEASEAPSIAWSGTGFGLAWESYYNGATQIHFTRLACLATCPDQDGDGYSCSDCDDTRADVHPGAAEVCDGVDQNCNGAIDEGRISCGTGVCTRVVDMCVAGVAQVCIPGPPGLEVCDGLDNDCDGAIDEDGDGDGYGVCLDCQDSNPAIFPGAPEVCNGLDDNCNGQIDEDTAGVDSDGDGVHNDCDNCRFAYNPTQQDTDHDGVGNACDNCILVPNLGQTDLDSDQRCDACDNCPAQYNPLQDDSDTDGVGDVCDNCPTVPNPDQGDINHDFVGDVCDLNDGLILMDLPDEFTVEWQRETGSESFNLYRGDLAVLKSMGLYTQDPSAVPLADRQCGLSEVSTFDVADLPVGKAVFFLVTGVHLGVEGSLGTNSAGVLRPNSNPCP